MNLLVEHNVMYRLFNLGGLRLEADVRKKDLQVQYINITSEKLRETSRGTSGNHMQNQTASINHSPSTFRSYSSSL